MWTPLREITYEVRLRGTSVRTHRHCIHTVYQRTLQSTPTPLSVYSPHTERHMPGGGRTGGRTPSAWQVAASVGLLAQSAERPSGQSPPKIQITLASSLLPDPPSPAQRHPYLLFIHPQNPVSSFFFFVVRFQRQVLRDLRWFFTVHSFKTYFFKQQNPSLLGPVALSIPPDFHSTWVSFRSRSGAGDFFCRRRLKRRVRQRESSFQGGLTRPHLSFHTCSIGCS